MRDGLRRGGRFIPDGIVGVHKLSLLASSRVAHDRATEDNRTQESKKESRTEPGTELLVGTVNDLDREVLNSSPCE